MHGQTCVEGPGRGSALLDRAVAIWRKAQILYETGSWRGKPEAVAIAEELAASHPECESALASLLLDASQLVAAYALLTLELMDSPILQNIPPEVLQRRSRVTLTTGSINVTTDLGSLARQAQLRARKRAGLPPASPSPKAKEAGTSAER
jgi:hypothetical protein